MIQLASRLALTLTLSPTGTMQTEKRDAQELRQDLQDEQDELPMRDESPNAETVFLMPILVSILSIL